MSRLIQSLIAAISGLGFTIKTEKNLKIHLLAFLLVVGAGLYFSITSFEWISVFLISCMVISLELANTALERLCDFVEPKHNEKIKIIKDTAAAAVLVAAAFAVCIAFFIFFPYFFTQL